VERHRGMSLRRRGTESAPQSPDLQYRVFEELYPSLRRFAAVVADLDMDPDDLVHDALAATLRRQNLSELRHPAAYLKQAIYHAAVTHRRRGARIRGFVNRQTAEAVETDHYPSDLAILDTLGPLDRAVIFMADVEGQPHEVIAQELGLTAGAVRKRASRARKRLRLALQAEQVEQDGETAATWSPGPGPEQIAELEEEKS